MGPSGGVQDARRLSRAVSRHTCCPLKPSSVASSEVQSLSQIQRDGGRPHAVALPWEGGCEALAVVRALLAWASRVGVPCQPQAAGPEAAGQVGLLWSCPGHSPPEPRAVPSLPRHTQWEASSGLSGAGGPRGSEGLSGPPGGKSRRRPRPVTERPSPLGGLMVSSCPHAGSWPQNRSQACWEAVADPVHQGAVCSRRRCSSPHALRQYLFEPRCQDRGPASGQEWGSPRVALVGGRGRPRADGLLLSASKSHRAGRVGGGARRPPGEPRVWLWDGSSVLGPLLGLTAAVVSDAPENAYGCCGARAVLVVRAVKPHCLLPGPQAAWEARGPDPAPLVLQQQNFKQKVVALLRRFKVSDEVSERPEEGSGGPGRAEAGSAAHCPHGPAGACGVS